MIDKEVLEKTLIQKCIELYEKVLAGHAELVKEKPDVRWGVPFQYMFLQMFDAVRRTEHFYKRTFVKAWLYKDNVLRPMPEGSSIKNNMKVSGMYYECASGRFFWDLDRMKAFVDMTYGPRYGRGYSYDIRVNEDGITLEKEEIQWVS
ncbi:MAG: hypothetical protein IKS10_07555 [Lachnospiraceae bacterium]|nr:hypothetical protein [Lachnospiraceae bacterium]